MPMTKKGEKIMEAMHKQYGAEKGDRVFYASKNKGTIKGVEKKRKGRKGKSKAGAKRFTPGMMDKRSMG